MNVLFADRVHGTVRRAAFGDTERGPSWARPERVVLPGARRQTDHFRWRVAGDCRAPVWREMYGRPHEGEKYTCPLSGQRHALVKPQWLELEARCRVCPECLRHKARLWRGRALGEVRDAQERGLRVWFCTFTSNHRSRAEIRRRAVAKFDQREGGWSFSPAGLVCAQYEDQPDDFRFKSENAEILSEISLWLKRIRMSPVVKWRGMRRGVKWQAKAERVPGERPGRTRRRTAAEVRAVVQAWEADHPQPKPARLRYLLVTEAHKSGFPHHHMLLIEQDHQISERTLRDHWRGGSDWMGYFEAKLVKGRPEDALYLCKYISKSPLARVRASQAFGHTSVGQEAAPSGGRDANAIATLNANPDPLRNETGSKSEGRPPFQGGSGGRLETGAPKRSEGLKLWATLYGPTGPDKMAGLAALSTRLDRPLDNSRPTIPEACRGSPASRKSSPIRFRGPS